MDSSLLSERPKTTGTPSRFFAFLAGVGAGALVSVAYVNYASVDSFPALTTDIAGRGWNFWGRGGKSCKPAGGACIGSTDCCGHDMTCSETLANIQKGHPGVCCTRAGGTCNVTKDCCRDPVTTADMQCTAGICCTREHKTCDTHADCCGDLKCRNPHPERWSSGICASV